MSEYPRIKRKEFSDVYGDSSQKEIDGALSELQKSGDLEHAGFKEGDDSFRLTPKGFEFAEKMIATDPHQALFLLSMAIEEPILFYKIIGRINELRKEIK